MAKSTLRADDDEYVPPDERDIDFLLPPSVQEWTSPVQLGRYVVELVESLNLQRPLRSNASVVWSSGWPCWRPRWRYIQFQSFPPPMLRRIRTADTNSPNPPWPATAMRVLHIGKYYPPFAGGMEHFLADLLPAQQALGLEVAALVHHEGPGWQGSVPARGDPPPFIYRAPCHGRLLYAPLSPSFPWWLDRLIRDFAPDLLHLHLPNTSAFAALSLRRARRLPWVIHWHADVVTSAIDRRLALAYGFYRPFEQSLLRRSRAIIATSPPYLAASQALQPWRERCVTIPLGLDPGRLRSPDTEGLAHAQAHWGEAPLRVLAIGRLTYYKGHEVLIRASASLPGVQTLIIGGGEYRQRLERLIQTLNLGDRVRLTGYRSEAEVAALLASCDLVCLPSLERTEAFGLVLLEAMRYAKPVVVSDIPGSGAPWLVRCAQNGILTPPGDPQGLARGLSELQAHPERRQQLGIAGTLALQREFGIQPVAVAINHLYGQVLGGPGNNPLGPSRPSCSRT